MFRTRRFTPRVARPKRKMVWAHQSTSLASSAGAQSVDLLTNFKTATGTTAGPFGITIRRIRISIQIDFDLTSTVLNRDSGIYLTTLLETGGIASASVPTASSNPDKDFNFRIWLPASGGLGVGVPTQASEHIFISREFDIKSMRKLHDIGDTLYFSAIPTGAVGAAWRIEASTLLLLP